MWFVWKIPTKYLMDKLLFVTYLNLLLCELGLCCQGADLSHGGVGELLVCAAQQGIGVHGGAVGRDAAEGNQ